MKMKPKKNTIMRNGVLNKSPDSSILKVTTKVMRKIIILNKDQTHILQDLNQISIEMKIKIKIMIRNATLNKNLNPKITLKDNMSMCLINIKMKQRIKQNLIDLIKIEQIVHFSFIKNNANFIIALKNTKGQIIPVQSSQIDLILKHIFFFKLAFVVSLFFVFDLLQVDSLH